MLNKDKTARQEARKATLENFNPNENGLKDHGIFGLPFNDDESELVLVPLPWEATVSYKAGTADGPQAILNASQQIDLYDPINPTGWKEGIVLLNVSHDLIAKSTDTRIKVEKYLEQYMKGEIDQPLLNEINQTCESFKEEVKKQTTDLLDQGKLIGIVGGDHSVPLGYMEALASKEGNFGILHLDAHADLREAYEGFEYSHASIFYNALKIPQVEKLVQVGIRDFAESEKEVMDKEGGRVVTFTEYEMRKKLFEGNTWASVCEDVVSKLPEKVYISFDIDGLSPHLSPNTGTPVLGGFSLEELVYLFEKVLSSGKKIIGFDLCEVAPGKDGEWDGNVGARVLYKLCLLALKSNKKQNV